MKRSLASDNFAGVHPDILKAISECNQGHEIAYGGDTVTKRATEKFKEHFGPNIEVFFVCNGTAANVLGLKAITLSHQAVLCASSAHINVDECGASENYVGCKLITLPHKDGKITIDALKPYLEAVGNQHHVQPKIISITQATELGTVYRPEEIREITKFAHAHGMYVHMDGARICNAAASLRKSLKEITADVGVDILSFGGTKNGLMFGEAVVFFNPTLAKEFAYIRKQGLHLTSKMRFISAQFIALLSNDLWLKNASHANAMAKLLADRLKQQMPQIPITHPVEINAVFAILPQKHIKPLQEQTFFWVWDSGQSEVRWMTAWDTQPEDIETFIALLKKLSI